MKSSQKLTGMVQALTCGGPLVVALAVVLGLGITAVAKPEGGSKAETVSPPEKVGGPLICAGADSGHVKMMVGKTQLLRTSVRYTRVSVGQPEIMEVNSIAPTSILLTAKKPGATQLIVWDETERAQVVEVLVMMDVEMLQGQLRAMLPDSKIQATVLNGQIALRGRVSSIQEAEQAVAIAAPYTNKVLNFLEVSGGQQVMLQVRFAEVSRTANQKFGFNVFATDGVFKMGINNGPAHTPIGSVSGGTLADATISTGVTIFGGGQLGNTAFEYFIQAMRDNALLRILAEPNLIAMSGQEASFLAGGEFPVPVPQTGGAGGGGTTITIEYREFGVKLNFTPVVLGDGKIRLKVSPEVSDLDFTTAVQFDGFVTPGLSKRKVTTTIELGDGQTFAIAGLLNNNTSASKTVTPLLGDLPVVGSLFRSVRYQRKETELVVLVTPRLVDGLNPGQVPAIPGEHWRYPTEAELFWDRDLGGPLKSKDGAPLLEDDEIPRFEGSYGFREDEAADTDKE